MNTETIPYNHFVSGLAKPGQAIIDSLSPTLAELWHMAGELRGEFLELEIAINKRDRQNILEEAGDMLFFLQGGLSSISLYLHTRSDLQEFCRKLTREHYHEFFQRNPHLVIRQQPVEEFATRAKRIVIYGQAIAAHRSKMKVAALAIVYHLMDLLEYHGFTLEDAFTSNREKLAQRYQALGYSDSASTERADKTNDPADQ